MFIVSKVDNGCPHEIFGRISPMDDVKAAGDIGRIFGVDFVVVILDGVSLLASTCHVKDFLLLLCLLMCFVRWSLLMKRWPHVGHTNFFSPVWVLLCRDSSSDREKRLLQFSHVQTKGFSPRI